MTSARETPRQRIEAVCARDGRAAFARRCVALLEGREVDPALVGVLAGAPASWGLHAPAEQAYWLRVWAVRGLLWAWDDVAVPAILVACSDDAWRVREMAAKVVARHRVDSALPGAAKLADDPVPRVRAAARRALASLTRGAGSG